MTEHNIEAPEFPFPEEPKKPLPVKDSNNIRPLFTPEEPAGDKEEFCPICRGNGFCEKCLPKTKSSNS